MNKILITLLFFTQVKLCMGAAAGAGAQVERKEAATQWKPMIYEISGKDFPRKELIITLRNRTEKLIYYQNRRGVPLRSDIDGIKLPPLAEVANNYGDIDGNISQIFFGKDIKVKQNGSSILFRTTPSIPEVLLKAARISLIVISYNLVDRQILYIDLIENKSGVGPEIIAIPGVSPAEEKAIYSATRQCGVEHGKAPVFKLIGEYAIGEEAYKAVEKSALPAAPGGPVGVCAAAAGAGASE